MVMLTIEDVTLPVDDKKISIDLFIRITMQYGKSADITAQEILEVLHLKPFDMIIKKGE